MLVARGLSSHRSSARHLQDGRRVGASTVAPAINCGHRRVHASAQAASAQQQGPPIMRVPPELLAEGGLDPAADGDAALQRFSSHLAGNYVPVDVTGFAGRLRVLNVEPPVLKVERFLTDDQCDALVDTAAASGRMATSGVGGHNVSGKDDIRTSRTLPLTSDVLKELPDVASALEALLTQARKLLPAAPSSSASQFSRPSGGPENFSFELPQVAHYRQGQHFLSHEDAFPPDIAQSKGYQRRATLLTYLNDVSDGGQTRFDLLGFGVQPTKGSALLFFPSLQWCAPDRRTLHTAEDAADDKWVCQLWLSSGLPPPPPGAKPQLPPGLRPAARGQAGGAKKSKKAKRKGKR